MSPIRIDVRLSWIEAFPHRYGVLGVGEKCLSFWVRTEAYVPGVHDLIWGDVLDWGCFGRRLPEYQTRNYRSFSEAHECSFEVAVIRVAVEVYRQMEAALGRARKSRGRSHAQGRNESKKSYHPGIGRFVLMRNSTHYFEIRTPTPKPAPSVGYCFNLALFPFYYPHN